MWIFHSEKKIEKCKAKLSKHFLANVCYFYKTFQSVDFLFIFIIFTLFYINRRKYWFRANFRFPVFDGFTRFRMSWSRFDYFGKMSDCLCATKNILASIARELTTRISWKFTFEIFLSQILAFQFLLKRWRYSQTFSRTFGIMLSPLLFDRIAK